MNDRMRNALVAAGAALSTVAVGAGISQMIGSTMVREALDRKEPELLRRAKGRMLGASAGDAALHQSRACSEQLLRKATQRVEILSRDGVRLVGHWYPCQNPKRLVVAMHGWRSSWSWDFGTAADFLRDSGCSVLFAEQRGQGESGGEYIGFGLVERYDCLEWVNWISAQGGDGLPVYLAGVSMGATTVLMAAGLELPENVRGIVADCGYTSPKAIWKHVMENSFHIPYGLYERQIEALCRRRLNCGSEDYSTLDAMKVNRRPILFVHGEADGFVPVSMTVENYKACTAPKRILTVPGAEHGMSYFTATERYKKAVLDFFTEFDADVETEN